MRSPDAVLALIRGIDVPNNFAFLPHRRALVNELGTWDATPVLTFCNVYVNVCTSALGCPIAPTKANSQLAWLLSSPGKLAGWMYVDSETARQRATTGYPTLAAIANPTGHGHIALVVPPPSGDGRMFVSSAGTENFVRAPLERSFGSHKDVHFFTHE